MNQYQHAKKSTFQYKLLTAIVIAALAILSGVGIFQYYRAKALSQEMENQYVRAFHDMVDYVRDVDVLLKKSMLATDAGQLSSISSEVFMQAASAKACLAQLPTENDHLGQTSKFLSQVGDYTSYLAAKVIDSQTVTDEEFDNLMQLSTHATSVSETLDELQSRLYNENLSLESVIGLTAHASEDGGEGAEVGGLYQIEKEFQDYPSLIYDGPFSEHIEKAEPVALAGKAMFSQDEALEIARRFVGDRGADLSFSEDGTGSIPTYTFTATRKDESQISIAITKQGGMVLWMLDSRDVTEANLSVEDSVSAGAEFLQHLGFSGMKESYYERSGNTVTVNYAYVGHDVVMYSDLIKIKIALDDGSVVGFESRGYIMSHTERELPAVQLSESDAREKISSHLTIDQVQLALIPLESQREVLCYECRGKFNGQNYLIYLNAVTGKEEKILLLLESDEGVLTM